MSHFSPFLFYSEILVEERRERDESMWRENRRVQAVSWGSSGSGNGEDLPPPKPSRTPATYVGIGGGVQPATSPTAESLPGPTTYLVAPNSEVLAQLMRDNENRADAGMYTAPASAFNTFTVEFSHASSSSNPASPQHKSKTKGRKQQHQPVYANIMMADEAAANCGPAPVKDVRIAWSRHLVCMVLVDFHSPKKCPHCMAFTSWIFSYSLYFGFELPTARIVIIIYLLFIFGLFLVLLVAYLYFSLIENWA